MCVNSSDAVQQMNSELQHAQLELLSAHCAVHQLRLHYSVNELACFDRRDVVRKSAEAASALHDFYSRIESSSSQCEPPAISHMDSVTFGDVIVFNQHVTLRALFHALVHSAQIQILGLRRYAELWVQSFAKTRTHFTVPLEVHAFTLSSKFLSPLTEKFSVEEQILRWKDEGRY